MADYSITGSGGLEISGAAEFGILGRYSIVGAGGVEVSGVATFTFTPKIAVYGSGGIGVSGTATIKVNKVVSPIGGVRIGGTASIVITPAILSTTALDAIAITLENQANSHYSNFAFDSLISYKGELYGTLNGVVYHITGTTDAGTAILQTVRTALTDFGALERKNVEDVYINCACSGAATVTSITDNNTQSTPQTIAAISGVTDMQPRRAKMPLGRVSRLWGFELKNVAGASLTVDSIDPLVSGTKRRI